MINRREIIKRSQWATVYRIDGETYPDDFPYVDYEVVINDFPDINKNFGNDIEKALLWFKKIDERKIAKLKKLAQAISVLEKKIQKNQEAMTLCKLV